MRTRWLVFPFGLILATTSLLFSQDRRPLVFEFGAGVGIPFTPSFGTQPIGLAQTGTQNQDRPPIVAGPVIHAVLYNRALIEFDALYRAAQFDAEIITPGSCIDPQCTMRNRGTADFLSGHGRLWEFPLTANYYVGEHRTRPYLGGGIVLSQDLSGTINSKVTDPTTGALTSFSGPFGQFRPLWPSFIADAGVEWSRSRFRLRPELRYTRHRADEDAFGFLPLHLDQFDLLFSITFPKR